MTCSSIFEVPDMHSLARYRKSNKEGTYFEIANYSLKGKICRLILLTLLLAKTYNDKMPMTAILCVFASTVAVI